ncbi:unnamed protein product [Protopolystoma xenopodis]|uniref:Uncharacterized protein n=1 Tax=Protopolystoma xenopodis TaxID=117903 RepID=A0A448XSP5_9PLAT|nr:unnamed protein product [Protopolystoma xenopodis]
MQPTTNPCSEFYLHSTAINAIVADTIITNRAGLPQDSWPASIRSAWSKNRFSIGRSLTLAELTTRLYAETVEKTEWEQNSSAISTGPTRRLWSACQEKGGAILPPSIYQGSEASGLTGSPSPPLLPDPPPNSSNSTASSVTVGSSDAIFDGSTGESQLSAGRQDESGTPPVEPTNEASSGPIEFVQAEQSLFESSYESVKTTRITDNTTPR